MTWLWWVVGGALVLLVGQTVHLAIVLASSDEATTGLGYFGLPPDERDAFKAKLRRQAILLSPILRVMGRFSGFTFEKASFEQDGLHGPRGTCTPESFASGRAYAPRPEDVFVATQMKCGTTWMQQIVYEVLRRGRGSLAESGTALYAISPWLESVKSVPISEAPLVGTERPSRIIKTHLPATACPLEPQARYIYVARHPVSCFASCIDFIEDNAGRLAPPLGLVEDWFCSDEMWWGPWPAHVDGWWRAAQTRGNVLFVHFEEMKSDLAAIVKRVAMFLGLADLSDDELDEIVRKSGFEYMHHHASTFEMHPPHLLATDARMFVKGTTDRHGDVPTQVRDRVAAWCASALEGEGYPLSERYPDVVAGPDSTA